MICRSTAHVLVAWRARTIHFSCASTCLTARAPPECPTLPRARPCHNGQGQLQTGGGSDHVADRRRSTSEHRRPPPHPDAIPPLFQKRLDQRHQLRLLRHYVRLPSPLPRSSCTGSATDSTLSSAFLPAKPPGTANTTAASLGKKKTTPPEAGTWKTCRPPRPRGGGSEEINRDGRMTPPRAMEDLPAMGRKRRAEVAPSQPH